MARVKHLFTKTRFPYIIIFLIITLIIIGSLFKINGMNPQANQVLHHWHTENVEKIDRDQHKIFRYRAELSALSDEHNAYLMQNMFSQMMNNQQRKKNKVPHLRYDPKYMSLNSHIMKIDDLDEGHIHNLNVAIEHYRKQNRYSHNHSTSTNAFHPLKAPVFTNMTELGGGIAILLIIDLYVLVYTVKFKDIQLKKFKEAQIEKKQQAEEAKRQHYIKEYGDDRGFKEND